MIESPMDVLQNHPVRKSRKQKRSFRDAVQAYAEHHGYRVKVESGSLGSRNIVIGDPETARYLVTAHYDTPASLWVPNLMIPCNLPLFLLSQIVLTVLLYVPTLAAAWLAMHLASDTMLWYVVTLAMVWLTLLWMLAGPANPHNANDNTSGVVVVLEMMASVPQVFRDRVCFVLFDMEEQGMIGSASYRKKHRHAVKIQTVLNLDCVGDGDNIMLFPDKNVKQDHRLMEWLCAMERSCGDKSIQVRREGFAFFPSDQMGFPRGIGICALRGKGRFTYVGRIHTFRDNVLDYTNINILRACLVTLIISGAVE